MANDVIFYKVLLLGLPHRQRPNFTIRTSLRISWEIQEKLIQADYEYLPRITQDHVPLGEDGNPKLWRKFLFVQPKGGRRANVHVRIEGNPNQRYALLFRDYLRAHPMSARNVEHIKRQIAKHHAEDVDAYYDIKDPVYDLIWDAAKDWARNTGWDPNRCT